MYQNVTATDVGMQRTYIQEDLKSVKLSKLKKGKVHGTTVERFFTSNDIKENTFHITKYFFIKNTASFDILVINDKERTLEEASGSGFTVTFDHLSLTTMTKIAAMNISSSMWVVIAIVLICCGLGCAFVVKKLKGDDDHHHDKHDGGDVEDSFRAFH